MQEGNSSMGSGVARGAVGAALFGGIGAIAGANSAKKNSDYTVSIIFKDGTKALCSLDADNYKAFVQHHVLRRKWKSSFLRGAGFLSAHFGLHLLDLEPLDVPVHAIQRVQLQSFVEGVGFVQLGLRGNTRFDKRVHSQLKLAEASEVEVSPFSDVGVPFRSLSIRLPDRIPTLLKKPLKFSLITS